MIQELSYNQVINLLANSESDTFIQQVIILLTLVHETISSSASLSKADFVFTQYEEGHILVSYVNNSSQHLLF